MPWHAVTITQWHQVSWSHMHVNLPSKFFLHDYIYIYIYSCCDLTVSVTVKVCGQAVQYPHFQNCDCVKPMPGIELTRTSKSNSFGFGKLSPCKCGSYLGMYSAYPYIWINHWHFLFEHMQRTQVQTQTLITAEHQYVAKPNNFMTLSAFALLCCMCWPAFIFAIVAMIYSTQVLALYCNVIL